VNKRNIKIPVVNFFIGKYIRLIPVKIRQLLDLGLKYKSLTISAITP